jgi:hypothetical protein
MNLEQALLDAAALSAAYKAKFAEYEASCQAIHDATARRQLAAQGMVEAKNAYWEGVKTLTEGLDIDWDDLNAEVTP